MPCKLRMQYPGAVYHVVNRRDRREDIFKDDQDRERFLATLKEACQKSEEFLQELLAAAEERVGASHDGADRRESGEEKAGRIVREELRRRGWKEQDLPGGRKGDNVKVALARRWRQETTMSLKWIARRLHMGSWTCVSNLLQEQRKH